MNGVKKMSCHKIKEKREGFSKFLVCALSQTSDISRNAVLHKYNHLILSLVI